MAFAGSVAHRHLKTKAQSRIKQFSGDRARLPNSDAHLDELHLHQVELELQYEELRQAQTSLGVMRDRYVDLFEAAPIAYLTLSEAGQISNINERGASLLIANKKLLLGCPFEQFVMADDQASWRRFFGHAKLPGQQSTCELTMRRRDGTFFFGRLCTSLAAAEEGLPELRIALTDVSDCKRVEQAAREFQVRLSKLTKREREILVLALAGKINKDISVTLKISQRAVENYRSRIHVKTGSATLLELSHQAAVAEISLEKIINS